jgi:C4-dicarboxylate-specific signal transduction histidine kinase
MIARIGHTKNWSGALPAMIFVLLQSALALVGCGPAEPPLSPQAQTFKKEIRQLVQEMQQSLTGPVANRQSQAIDAVLSSFAGESTNITICADCPYKSAVLDKDGVLLTTFPKNEFIGRNFSAYKFVSDPLKKQIISPSKAFQPNGAKIYFLSAPLINNNKVVGILVLGLTPNDLEKWHLNEKDFLAIDFNEPR